MTATSSGCGGASRPWLLVALLLLTGCAGAYFREAPPPSQHPLRYSLSAWPYQAYWTGIVFNGEKIGLTHLALIPDPADPDRYELRSEALLAFHFLGFSKTVTLKAQDWVAGDLTLVRFVHEYDLDGQKMKLTGRVERGRLTVERENAGRRSLETIPLAEVVYPTSAVPLYPALQGLEVGKRYDYLAYDGQRRQVVRVSQAIETYQESDLYEGRAFRVTTSTGGQDSTLWLNDRGEPVLEMAWHGILISTLETETRAKAYLARASLNKREVLLEYSRIRANTTLPRPRAVTSMAVAVEGLPSTFTMPADALQQCGRPDERHRGRIQCLIRAAELSRLGTTVQTSESQETDLTPYLNPTAAIPSHDGTIRNTARDVVGEHLDRLAQVRLLVEWIREHVAQKPVDVFSALEVLEGRKAECQGITLLYAALARSLGIPTKVTNGLVYTDEPQGFLYHTWAESYVGDVWLPVDPTFGQVGVDATHIKLIDGDRLADLLPLVDLVGRIRVDILSYAPIHAER